MVEVIGIFASIIVLLSFIMKDIKSIRIINISGSVLFVVYGILINSFATWFLNGALIIVHIVYLIKNKEV